MKLEKIKITKKNLREEYDFLKNSEYKGVKGVCKIDSGIPGPVFGITVCTHGNELAGLGAVYYLRNVFKLQQKIKKGSVLVVINNLKACEKALNAKSVIEKNKARYIDMNMNRLPADLLGIKDSKDYEIERAQNLMPIWEEFDCAIDIHGTFKDSEPMIIITDTTTDQMIKGFPIEIVIKNIDKVQIGKPAFAFYGGDKNIPQVEIESGQNEDPKSYKTTVECILNLLSNTGFIELDTGKEEKRRRRIYEMLGSIILPNDDFEMVKTFEGFEFIEKRQLLATDGKDSIFAEQDCHAIMPPAGKKAVKLGEEVMFLSRPVKMDK